MSNSFKDKYDKRENYYNKLKVECKNCGHKVLMPAYVDNMICSWCNKKVVNTSKAHFIYKINKNRKGDKK